MTSFVHQPTVVRARDRAEGLDSALGHRGVDCVAARATDSENTDTIVIHVGQRHEVVDDVAEVLDTECRVLDEARLAAAGALEACVERDDDEPFRGEGAAVDVARRDRLCGINDPMPPTNAPTQTRTCSSKSRRK